MAEDKKTRPFLLLDVTHGDELIYRVAIDGPRLSLDVHKSLSEAVEAFFRNHPQTATDDGPSSTDKR